MPRQQVTRQVQSGGATALRIATHNVHGLEAHVTLLAEVWVHMRLDVILLQETWVQFYDAARVAKLVQAACKRVDPQHRGFEMVWGFNTAPNANHSAGVAVLVRKVLADAGQITIQQQQVKATEQGRLVCVPIQWGGHSVTLVSVHLPNVSTEQQHFIDSHMVTHMPQGTTIICGGDFNFVPQPALDKVSVHAQVDLTSPVAARVLQQHFPDLCDSFRVLHPVRRAYTHHCVTCASRLDRVYVSSAMQQYVQACNVGNQSPSDHRPVVVQIGARVAPAHGPGLRRARVAQVWQVQSTRQQLVQGVQALAAEAPTEGEALIAWWPVFKGECMLLCEHLAREARMLSTENAGASRQQAAAHLAGAFDQVERASAPQQLEAALQLVLQARQHWREQVMQQAQMCDIRQRRQWIHTGERPNPVLTSEVRTKAALQDLHVSGIQCPSTGKLLQSGGQIAQAVADFWGRIGLDPAIDAPAGEQVMGAVRAANLTMPPSDADAVGDPQVTAAEVQAALKHSQPGKAPGLDGLPVELYRRCMGVCAPLLARLYTAMGTTGYAPRGFNDGVIVVFHKAGTRSDPANYRPITLLNTDYRVLAKLLAIRLRPVQGAVIEPEQTAFLPRRLIGDNIMLLQLLPHALPASSKAACVFLDFRKAYDTVSRPFLYQLLQQAGLGGGFLAWVKLLLRSTHSCACVNGYTSNMVSVAAGVRQGCPLAPQLYLFVAQALLSFLKAKGIGVTIGSRRVTATQFADDAQVFLEASGQVSELLQVMAVFKAATGQGLNVGKCKLLLMGYAARKEYWCTVFSQWLSECMSEQRAQQSVPQPAQASPQRVHGGKTVTRRERVHSLRIRRTSRGAFKGGVPGPQQLLQQMREQMAQCQQASRKQVMQRARVNALASRAASVQLCDDLCGVVLGSTLGGLPLVDGAPALGVKHMADGRSEVDWSNVVDAVESRYTKICRLPLSRFGRAFAASGYGLSKLLYAAEFVGMPPQGVLQELYTNTAKLVNRAQLPNTQQHVFAGVSAQALVGHPKEGGFGVMPLEQHIRARHAKWAIRLMCEHESIPWVYVARYILSPPMQAGRGMWNLALAACNAATPDAPCQLSAPWLQRGIPAPLQRLAQALQVLPVWTDVRQHPLQLGPWCANAPLWCNPFIGPGSGGKEMRWRGLEAQFPELATLGTVTTVGDAVAALADVQRFQQHQQYQATVWPFWLKNHVLFADQQVAHTMLSRLVAAIPSAWKQAAAQNSGQAGGQLYGQQQHVLQVHEVAAMLISRLGWVSSHGKQCPMQDITVKQCTVLQQRAQLLGDVKCKYVGAVLHASGVTATPDALAQFQSFLQQLWKLSWDNKRKEVMWRLLHNGFPTAARMGGRIDMPCACGAAVPDWLHHFWHCPVAQAVIQVLQSQLPQGAVQLQPCNVLLGGLPHAAVHSGVWKVVVLAALNAMEKCRGVLTTWHLKQVRGEVLPQHVHTSGQRLQVASKLAVSTFWDMLQDFVSLRLVPQPWLMQVGFQHPFLAVHVAGNGDLALRVHRAHHVQF